MYKIKSTGLTQHEDSFLKMSDIIAMDTTTHLNEATRIPESRVPTLVKCNPRQSNLRPHGATARIKDSVSDQLLLISKSL